MLKPNDSSTNLTINENLKLMTTLKAPIKKETTPPTKKDSNKHLAKASKLSGVVGFLAEKWLTTNKSQQTSKNLSTTNYLNKKLFDNNKDHDELLASTSIKSDNNDNINENIILNTNFDYSTQPFLNLLNNQNLSSDSEIKNYNESVNVSIEKDMKIGSESEESIQIDTTQNKIDCGTSCCSQSSTNSFVSTIIVASTGCQEETASSTASEVTRLVSISPETSDSHQDSYLNNSECKQDSMNFTDTLFSNSKLLAVKMEEDLELNNRIISEFYDSAAKRRKIQMPQKTQHLYSTLEKTKTKTNQVQLKNNKTIDLQINNSSLNGATSETLNTQFDELDISNQNASTIFETFNQFFLNGSNELETLNNLHQINGSANLKFNTLLSLFNNDPASVLALFNSTSNIALTNNDISSVPLLNSNLGIFDTIGQTGIDNSNTTDLLNLYNSILQLTGFSTENGNITESKVNDQALIAEALNQFINIRDSSSSSEHQQLQQQQQQQQSDQQQQQILPTFDPSVLLSSEFASLLSAMTSQNFDNNEEDIEKNLCKENMSTLKNKNNFTTEQTKQLFEKEKKCNLESLTKDSTTNNLNLSKTSTSNSVINNLTPSTIKTSVIVNSSSTLTCSPSSSALSSPNSTSASSFSSPNNLATNINTSLSSFSFSTNSLTSTLKNFSSEKTKLNSPSENIKLVVTAVLEALINPSSAPAALSMISNDKNIQNLLIDYFTNCNNVNSFDVNSVLPNFDTDLSTTNVTEDMLKKALQKALKSARRNENTEKLTINNWSNSDIVSAFPSWFASSINSTSMMSNQKTNNFLNNEIMNDSVNKHSSKFLSNDQYHRLCKSGNENLSLSFTKNKVTTVTPTVASVLEERRRKRPRTTSKSSYAGTGSSVLVASSAIKNVSNALQAANLNGGLHTGPTTVSAVVNSSRAAGCSGSEFLELNELEEFANSFKKQRIKHGFTQGDVGVALGKRYGTDFSQTTISRFEALNLSYKNMCKLRPLLKEWLEEAEQMIENGATVVDILEAPSPILLHNSCSSSEANQNEWSETDEKNRNNNMNTNSALNPLTTPRLIGNSIIPPLKRRRKRTNLDNAQKASLDVFFKTNCRPDHQRMNEIATILELDPDVVRVWFCNRRQKLRKVC